MKTLTTFALMGALSLGLNAGAAESPAVPDNNSNPVANPATPDSAPAPAPDSVSVQQPEEAAPPSATQAAPAPETAPVAPAETTSGTQPALPPASNTPPSDGLHLNFRNAPLESVLKYMSEAAGFIIVPETEVKGTVDVWSAHPVSKEEAVQLLNAVLNRNGYAAIRQDRTLYIVPKDQAAKRNIPVKQGGDPDEIPSNDEMVTQIIPVRFINAVQVVKDLSQLLPEKAVLTANESGNALVLTDTQANIRRMAEIVKALDTSVASLSTVRVFALQYADAKELATTIKDLFQPQNATQNNNNGSRRFSRFRGGPFGGGGDNGGGGQEGTTGRPGAGSVVAVADERSNSLVVGAPEDLMPVIEKVVESVDTSVQDVTEVRVFRLSNADPLEMADLLTQLFPDETTQDDSRSQVRFGGAFGGPFGRFGRQNNQGNQGSDRMKKQGRVLAVPDQRTSSLVVSAAHDLMLQIEPMVKQLDSDPAKKQKVFVYSLENADVQDVENSLRDLFESQNSRTGRSTSSRQNTSPLGNRANSGSNSGQNRNNTLGGNNSLGGGSLGR